MNRIHKRFALPLALALAFGAVGAVSTTSVFAYDESSIAAINIDQGVILHGYDPVAYFTAGKPTQGSAQYAVSQGGATYHFASAANMKTFQSDPAKYVPQYGGFCAMGAALGKKLDVDPTQFKVVDNKLYLNVNADVFKKWSQDVPGNITKANANWPSIKDQAPSSL